MQHRNSAPAVPISYSSPARPDEGKLSISIDFGTTFSGVAYGSSRIAQQILIWPGANETYRKIPTCLVYDENGELKAWGLEAKAAANLPGTYKCEW
jgi:molecular chaperone DnaK (HSP70)